MKTFVIILIFSIFQQRKNLCMSIMSMLITKIALTHERLSKILVLLLKT